jgi:hypothetical protein
MNLAEVWQTPGVQGAWFNGMGIQQPTSQGMQQLTPAQPIEWFPEI